MLTVKERIALLGKPYWNYKDISAYFNIKTTKAIAIKNEAIQKYDGQVKYLSHYVKTNSVLAIVGTTREDEMSFLCKYEKV